jgi:hypothetical protein
MFPCTTATVPTQESPPPRVLFREVTPFPGRARTVKLAPEKSRGEIDLDVTRRQVRHPPLVSHLSSVSEDLQRRVSRHHVPALGHWHDQPIDGTLLQGWRSPRDGVYRGSEEQCNQGRAPAEGWSVGCGSPVFPGSKRSALLTPKIVEFFTKISDQRERTRASRAVARIGWRPCRPALLHYFPREQYKQLALFQSTRPLRGTAPVMATTALPPHSLEPG